MEQEKLYYSITEVARNLGVNASLLRFWEKEFNIIKPFKNKKGNRYYTLADIENLKKIYYLTKECGYTLDGAKERMKQKQDTTAAISETVNTLQNIKSFLLKLKEEIRG